MHTDIAYNSLPVSELLAEFDERWPQAAKKDMDEAQRVLDMILDGGYAKMGANMRRLRKAIFDDKSDVNEMLLDYLNRAAKRYARLTGITGTTCSRGKYDSLLRTRDSSGRATARKAI